MVGSNVPTIRSAVNGTTLATTLTGLNPYTQYSCYVTANTSVGEGSPSTIGTAQSYETCEFYLHSLIGHEVQMPISNYNKHTHTHTHTHTPFVFPKIISLRVRED